MKLQGMLETNLGFALGRLHVGERDGQDCVQISFPAMGDMNNDTKNTIITDTAIDCIFDVNGMPSNIHIEKQEDVWNGTIKIDSIGFQFDLDLVKISDESCFAPHTFVIPEENVKKLKEHGEYQNQAIEGILSYELNNEEVLAYVKEKGIDVENNHDFVTICALMKKTSEIIHHDGVNYAHDGENIGTIAQMQFAEKQGNYTNCRGIAIILAGVLRAYGFKANVVECWPEKSDDIEIHVVCEVYAEDYQKTVLLDPSNNVIYFKDNKPLSLFELREVIANKETDSLTTNEDFSHNGDAVSMVELMAYMSKNVMILRKGICSDEKTELVSDNAISLVPSDLIEGQYPKSAIYTSNIQKFYTSK